jgi:hypothetical protein
LTIDNGLYDFLLPGAKGVKAENVTQKCCGGHVEDPVFGFWLLFVVTIPCQERLNK